MTDVSGEQPKFFLVALSQEEAAEQPRGIADTPEGQRVIEHAKGIFGLALSEAGIGITIFEDGETALDKGSWRVEPLGLATKPEEIS